MLDLPTLRLRAVRGTLREVLVALLTAPPTHLADRPELLAKLRREANGLSGLYGCAVYLCGSALRDDNTDPRDWDIRLELPDPDFERRYGPVAEWEEQGASGEWGRTRGRWADDCLKQSRLSSRGTRLNIDCQIYPLSHCDGLYADRPKLRLDTRPPSG